MYTKTLQIAQIFRVDDRKKMNETTFCDWVDFGSNQGDYWHEAKSEMWSNPDFTRGIEKELLDLGFGQ